MVAERCLIVNADDFGQSPGVNEGVIESFERGIVTSASLMVRWPAAAAAAAYARRRSELSIGLHVDLGEWAYCDGTWAPVYEIVPLDDASAVEEDVGRQLVTFRRLLGRDPSHLDSHQHVHREEPAGSILRKLAAQLGVPLRDREPVIRYCGAFYGQNGKGNACPGAISVDSLLNILKTISPGVTELGCHPGLGLDMTGMYRNERVQEVKTLCDPQIRTALTAHGIRLCSFRDFAGA